MNAHGNSSTDHRPPDWRARQAFADAVTGRLRLPRDAPFTQRWLTSELQGRTGIMDDALRSMLRDPAVQNFRAVVDYYCHRDRAAQLEALLLARVPWTVIGVAHHFSFAREYAELFYDVVDRLDDAPYIVDHAIRPEALHGPPATAKRRVAQKLFGFFCGADALSDLYHLGRQPAAAEYFTHPVGFAESAALIAQVDAVADWVLATDKSPPLRQISQRLKSIVELLGSLCRSSYPRSASAQALRSAVLQAAARLQPSPDATRPST